MTLFQALKNIKILKSNNFSFGNGTIVAVTQENLFQRYKTGQTIPAQEISGLENILWVNLAVTFAPCNLVIRQWCLLDLLKNTLRNKDNVASMINRLSYQGSASPFRIWAEGYSYWQYSRLILDAWVVKFGNTTDMTGIKRIIEEIDLGFVETAYLRAGVWYPAPFGDLRDVPLDPPLQINHTTTSKTIKTVSVTTLAGGDIKYVIKGRPIGLNTHIPKEDSTITVTNGVPHGFKFYTGYDKKYNNKLDEMIDTFNMRRVFAI
jgi:hypothetical protein